jgi:CBS domain-containing protein
MIMRARDIMTAPVITTKASAIATDLARLFARYRISAVPVVDDNGKMVGIVSEGDLMHRSEIGTERRHSWWLSLFTDPQSLATEYVEARARKVADLMTPDVVTCSPETSLDEIATLLETKSIKRVPVISNGQLVGIVSRANLVQALASIRPRLEIPLSDATIRTHLMSHLKSQPWAHLTLVTISVFDGVVSLWGMVPSEIEKRALRVAAEQTVGVRAVIDHLTLTPARLGVA